LQGAEFPRLRQRGRITAKGMISFLAEGRMGYNFSRNQRPLRGLSPASPLSFILLLRFLHKTGT
jgi:hypothetical protein